VVGLIWLYSSYTNAKAVPAVRSSPPTRPSAHVPERLAALREHDPNFSEYLFTDFAYALYARVQEARGRGDLKSYEPYLKNRVIEQLQESSPKGLKGVKGVIVGAARIVRQQTGEGLDQYRRRVRDEPPRFARTPEGDTWYSASSGASTASATCCRVRRGR
jgi:hypothetical protein